MNPTIFMYCVLICPILVVSAHSRSARESSSHFLLQKNTQDQDEPDKHVHRDDPCEVCPRGGACVPRVQCPALARPHSHSPSCHLPAGQLGVCCTTGAHHAAEADRSARTPTAISADALRTAHAQSRDKLARWQQRARQLDGRGDARVNVTAPSYGHHLSMVTYDKRAKELAKGALLNLFAAQELKSRQAISDQELELGLTEHTDGVFCPPPPQCPAMPSPYRRTGGECNNPQAPSWGAVHTAYERLLPPSYSDSIWAMRASVAGPPLPSARAVSSALLPDSSRPHPTHNLMFVQFGQFVAHDVTAGVAFTIDENEPISCCAGDGADFVPEELRHWACAAIAVAPDDPFFATFGHKCLNFVRTQLAPSHDCALGYGRQMNGVTHYQDLSQIYGSSDEKTASLRSPGGLLKTFNDYGRELPPLTTKKECQIQKDGAACFDSGDNHGNQIISLTVFHTIWTREHNRIARALARLNPEWDEDTVFYESRRIVQAEFQHITYNEWLPKVIGERTVLAFGLRPSAGRGAGYDPGVNPALTAEFAAAAMRFGHSTVDGKMILPTTKSDGLHETLSIPEVMFEPSRLRLRPFLDRLLRGLCSQPMQSVDPFVTESLTKYMFHGGNPYGLDLAAVNVQRGRDYGLRPYNDYRRLCGLQPYVNFEQFAHNVAQRLSSVYLSPDDIDLWIGGLLEEPVEDGVVGTTFASIIADQFSRLKRGDRYFYDYGPDVNPGAFTPVQLAEIKKVTMARLICDNSDGLELAALGPAAFLRADLPGNEPVPCDSPLIPWMDLSRFRML